MKRATAALAALLLAGCATQPIATSEARPSEEILAPAMTEPREGSERVIVKRDAGMNSGACDHIISLDGRDIAELSPREKVTFYATPGQYILGAHVAAICGSDLIETRIRVSRDHPNVYRTGVTAAGDIVLGPTSQ